MNEWEEFELDECCEILSSKRIFASDYVTSGIPFYRSKEIIEKAHGQFGGDELYITHDRFNEIKEKFGAPIKGDLLISAVGNRSGIPYCIREDYDFYFKDGNLIWFRNFSEELDSKFLEYILSSNLGQKKIEAMMIGSAQKALTIAGIKKIKLNLPPLPEQKAIAHILGKLDDKIELNRKTNETLEAMAQALFKSWFVDFDPVLDNALAAGNAIPEALQAKAKKRQLVPDDKKLIHNNPELAALFPSAFVFNETLDKWIPEGWELLSIDDAIQVNPKVSIKKGEVKKFVDMKSLPVSGYSVNGIIEKEFQGGAKFNQGDVLLARITPCLENGKTALVDFLNPKECGFGSTEFIVLRGKGEIKTSFVACLARYDSFVNHCIQNMVGSSGRQRVQNSCFSSFFLPIADDNIISKFHQIVDANFSKITENSRVTETLTKLRDTLLPQLISGKLRVPEGMLDRFQEQTKAVT